MQEYEIDFRINSLIPAIKIINNELLCMPLWTLTLPQHFCLKNQCTSNYIYVQIEMDNIIGNFEGQRSSSPYRSFGSTAAAYPSYDLMKAHNKDKYTFWSTATVDRNAFPNTSSRRNSTVLKLALFSWARRRIRYRKRVHTKSGRITVWPAFRYAERLRFEYRSNPLRPR